MNGDEGDVERKRTDICYISFSFFRIGQRQRYETGKYDGRKGREGLTRAKQYPHGLIAKNNKIAKR